MSSNPAFNTAIQYSRAGNHTAAEQVCRQILAANPADALAWCHLATTCLSLNRIPEAISGYEQALRYQPVFPEALNNLAVAMTRIGRNEEAIAIFNRAATQRPQWAEPLISLGNLYTNLEQSDGAIASFERAVRADPGNIEAHNLLASMLGKQGLVERAQQHFFEALRLNPRYATAHSNLLLAMNYDRRATPELMLAEHRWWERLHGRGLLPVPPHPNGREPDRVLRIGYVSPDFRTHVVPAFILPIFASHDPRQVEVYGYAEVSQPDAVTQRFAGLSKAFRSTVNRNDAQVVEMIRADRIDILIDLAGHTGGNRLGVFAHRPAPVQVSYLGYPTTTGLSTIDFRLTDSIADPPDASAGHSEQLIRLPRTWCCYQPPEDAPAVSPPPAETNGYVTFGSMHKLPKLNDGMLDLWAELLRRAPDSRLLIFRNTLDASIKQRLTASFTARGIDPQRLEITGGSSRNGAHLNVYSRIDIALDTLPWSGHATTCESVWMGVPMITQRGDRHAGRMSASILSAIGLGELIAETPEQYLQLAAALANDRPRLVTMRQSLRERMRTSPLCDAKAFTRDLEAAYRLIWRRWCENVG